MTKSAKVNARRQIIMNLLSERYQHDWLHAELRREFLRKDYVHLPGLFSKGGFGLLQAETERLKGFTQQKDFVMSGPETPRIMSVLGGNGILENSSLLWSLYSHYDLRNLIQGIVGAPIYPCKHPNEFMVINYLLAPGAIHGWHLDDPAYALVIIIDAPKAEYGGLTEFVPDWKEYCDYLGVSAEENVGSTIQQARADNRVRVKHHAPSDAYLLRADNALHQVTELKKEGVQRVIINLGFENTPDPKYGHTASDLYGD